MQAVIKINVDELTTEFVENLRKLFAGKAVEIKVDTEEEEMDATEFIMSKPAYAAELLRRINEYERTGEAITVQPEDLL